VIDDKEKQELKGLLWAISVLVVMVFIITLLGAARGCSTAPKNRTDTVTSTSTVTVTSTSTDTGADCDGLDVGDAKRAACPTGDGYKEWECRASGLVLTHDDCSVVSAPPTSTSTSACVSPFSDVQGIIQDNCVSCHQGFATYATAKAKAREFLRRIELPTTESQHMPKGGDLSGADKSTFRKWVEGGMCDTAGTQPPPARAFHTWAEATAGALRATAPVNDQDRLEYRWLYVGHAADSEAQAYKEAVAKALNSVSRERRAAQVTEDFPGLFRVELDDLGWTKAEWDLVERADPFNIVDKTSDGLELQRRTNTKKPVMHMEAFVQAALANAQAYRALNRISATFDQYMKDKGVDFKGDQRDGKVLQAAFVGSRLSPHNRMVAMFESTDGNCTVTFDTGPTDTPQKNQFNFPELPDEGGRLNTQFVAGESICDKANGTHEYALWNAKDTFVQGRFVRSDLNQAIDAADVDVVIDYRASQKGLSAVIKPGISCFSCHAIGMIPFTDQVRANVIAHGSEFNQDKDIILRVYRPQAEWGAFFTEANKRYSAALTAIGSAPRGEDPITVVSDATLGPWNLGRLAAFLTIPLADFRVLLDQSQNARAQIGQLLSDPNATITFDQVVQTLPLVIQDLRLFEDPL
jgi:hypothetical protein